MATKLRMCTAQPLPGCPRSRPGTRIHAHGPWRPNCIAPSPAASRLALERRRRRLPRRGAACPRATSFATGTRPRDPSPSSNSLTLARILAIMHAAQHDGVNGAVPGTRPTRRRCTTQGRSPSCCRGCRARSARRVLPGGSSRARGAARRVAGRVPDGDAEDAGVALGRAVGDVVLEVRADDGTAPRIRSSPVPGPGVWDDSAGVRADARAAVPERRAVHASRPHAVPAGRQPRLTSRRYARDYAEVKLVGRDISRARTPDQTHVAHFWVEPSASGWSRVGNLVSARYGYDLHRTARLQALLNMAMADGFFVGWFQSAASRSGGR